MVGVPMLKAERISRSGPKLSDAQTRNFEAIKYRPEGLRQAHQAREGHGPEDAGAQGVVQGDREGAGQVALDGERRGGDAQVRVSATVKTTILTNAQ